MSDPKANPNAKADTNPDDAIGAFGKDKLFGKRLDETFALHEPFLLLGAKIEGTIETDIGVARMVKCLVQKIDSASWAPIGRPIVCGTLGSAIADKVEALEDGELPAVVECQVVQGRFDKAGEPKTLVLQYLADPGSTEADVYADFGLDPVTVGAAVDKLRPIGERIPFPATVTEAVPAIG